MEVSEQVHAFVKLLQYPPVQSKGCLEVQTPATQALVNQKTIN